MSTDVLDIARVNALQSNPFYILGASTRDVESKINELAEERSLLGDEAECRDARISLLNPRHRLMSEMAWLPGVAPARAIQIADSVTSATPFPAGELPPLARANIFASIIQTSDERSDVDRISSLILRLASAHEEIVLADVLRDINEDRGIARIAMVQDISPLEETFDELKGRHRQSVREALDKMPSRKIIDVMCQSALNSFQVTASKSFHLVMPISAVSSVV